MAASIIHPNSKHHVAEEGQFSAASSTLPVLHYYPVRGRAEPIRLALAYNRQAWFEAPIEPIEAIKRVQLDGYTFRQLPRYIDEVHGDIDLVQSMAILRHIGRKFGMYGKNLTESALIDMVLEGVADLRQRLKEVWVMQQLEAAAVQRYQDTVMASEEQLTALTDFQGPGLACLDFYLQRSHAEEFSTAGNGWVVGWAPSIADMAMFDLVDLHLLQWGGLMRDRFPRLCAHHAQVAGLEPIAEYLQSENRHSKVWGVEWQPGQGQEGEEGKE